MSTNATTIPPRSTPNFPSVLPARVYWYRPVPRVQPHVRATSWDGSWPIPVSPVISSVRPIYRRYSHSGTQAPRVQQRQRSNSHAGTRGFKPKPRRRRAKAARRPRPQVRPWLNLAQDTIAARLFQHLLFVTWFWPGLIEVFPDYEAEINLMFYSWRVMGAFAGILWAMFVVRDPQTLGIIEVGMWLLPLYLKAVWQTGGHFVAIFSPLWWGRIGEIPAPPVPTSIFMWFKLCLDLVAMHIYVGFSVRNNLHRTWDNEQRLMMLREWQQKEAARKAEREEQQRAEEGGQN